MRSLIRPFLLTVARLGLFLAVVAWIVGQWRSVSLLLPVVRGTIGAELQSDAWRFRYTDFSFKVNLQNSFWLVGDATSEECVITHLLFKKYSERRWLTQQGIKTVYPSPGLLTEVDRRRMRLPGVNLVTNGNKALEVVDYVECPHGLSISSLLICNLLLHFMYRQRPEAEPCEA